MNKDRIVFPGNSLLPAQSFRVIDLGCADCPKVDDADAFIAFMQNTRPGSEQKLDELPLKKVKKQNDNASSI